MSFLKEQEELSVARMEEIATQLVSDLLVRYGLELAGVEYRQEGGQMVLRVLVDKPGRVTVEECARLSVDLSRRLDEVQTPVGPYRLEVSSPGLDRPLRSAGDFRKAVGRLARMTTSAPVNGRRELQGRITACGGQAVELELADGSVVEVPLAHVSAARLIAEV